MSLLVQEDSEDAGVEKIKRKPAKVMAHKLTLQPLDTQMSTINMSTQSFAFDSDDARDPCISRCLL